MKSMTISEVVVVEKAVVVEVGTIDVVVTRIEVVVVESMLVVVVGITVVVGMIVVVVDGMAMVVTSKVPFTPPIVSVACVSIRYVDAAVSLTHTVWPLATIPGTDVKLMLSSEYSPPAIEMGAGVSMPVTVIALDVTGVFGNAFVTGVKLNGSGTVSGKMLVVVVGRTDVVVVGMIVVVVVGMAMVVTSKAPFTPPIDTVAEESVI